MICCRQICAEWGERCSIISVNVRPQIGHRRHWSTAPRTTAMGRSAVVGQEFNANCRLVLQGISGIDPNRSPSFLVTGHSRSATGSRHIPDRFEHLVRFVGWYSCRCRGERARSAWVHLIYKVYEVDPLECPKCKGPMQVIALIDDPAVVRRILQHLNLWSPAKRYLPARGPPGAAVDFPATESTNALTYHPVPDIA